MTSARLFSFGRLARLASGWLLCGWLVSAGANSVSAQLLTYDFSNFDVTPTYQAAGITGGDLARDGNFNGTTFDTVTVNGTVGSPAPAASSSEWTSSAFDPNLYYTFTLTSSAAPTQLTGLIFDLQSSVAGGPTNFAVRSSQDAFAANLAAGSLTANFVRQTVALNLLAAAGQPVEFRIYGFGATDSGAVLNMDNVTVVPEPRTIVILLLAAALLPATRRRMSRAFGA